jgi:hypothetical protein
MLRSVAQAPRDKPSRRVTALTQPRRDSSTSEHSGAQGINPARGSRRRLKGTNDPSTPDTTIAPTPTFGNLHRRSPHLSALSFIYRLRQAILGFWWDLSNKSLQNFDILGREEIGLMMRKRKPR